MEIEQILDHAKVARDACQYLSVMRDDTTEEVHGSRRLSRRTSPPVLRRYHSATNWTVESTLATAPTFASASRMTTLVLRPSTLPSMRSM